MQLHYQPQHNTVHSLFLLRVVCTLAGRRSALSFEYVSWKHNFAKLKKKNKLPDLWEESPFGTSCSAVMVSSLTGAELSDCATGVLLSPNNSRHFNAFIEKWMSSMMQQHPDRRCRPTFMCRLKMTCSSSFVSVRNSSNK